MNPQIPPPLSCSLRDLGHHYAKVTQINTKPRTKLNKNGTMVRFILFAIFPWVQYIELVDL